MNRDKLLRAWLYAMSRLEVQLRVEQGRARNAMIRSAAYLYAANGTIPAHVFVAHRSRTRGVIEDAYRRTIPVFAAMALQQVKSRKIEKKTAQTIHEALIAQWISREALRKATMIADTDREDIQNTIQKGMDDGLGTEEIARNIRKVSELTPYRAATVARTETHAAATFGSIESVREAERELGVKMVKEWLPTIDNRTRDSHLAMAGVKVGMEEKFAVGKKDGGSDLMDRPGDPSASAENVVSCRCALAYEEAE